MKLVSVSVSVSDIVLNGEQRVEVIVHSIYGNNAANVVILVINSQGFCAILMICVFTMDIE